MPTNSPAELERYYRKARDFTASQNYIQAKEFATRALTIDSQHSGSLHILGYVQLLEGSASQARINLEQAYREDAGNVLLLRHLAMLYEVLQQFPDLLRVLEKLLRLQKKDHGLLLMLADTQRRLGHYDDAIAVLDELIQQNDNRSDLLLKKGNCLQSKRDYLKAILVYQDAIHLQPSPSLYFNLSLAARSAGKLEDAIEAIEHALKLEANYPLAWVHRGSLYEHQGNIGNAQSSYLKAIQYDPCNAEAHWSLANLKTYRFSEGGVKKIQSCLARKDLGMDHKIQLLFALSKAYDDQEAYSRAMECLQQANGLKRRTFHYSMDNTANLIESIRQTFNGSFIQKFKASTRNQSKILFIVGMPRSGSTLVEQILTSHSRIVAGGEQTAAQELAFEDLPRKFSRSFPDCVSSIVPADLNDLASAYVEKVGVLPQDDRWFTDKLPKNFQLVGLLAMMFPAAKFIYIRREPIDNCLSCYQQLFTTGQEFSYELNELAHYYKQVDLLMKYWQGLFSSRILNISYEALVASQKNTTETLLSFCEVDWEDACLHFYKNRRVVDTASSAQVRSAMYQFAVGKWNRYEAYIAPLLAKFKD